MEFVVIALFVAAIVLVNFLVGRAQKKRAARPEAAKAKAAGTGNPKGTGRAPAGTSLEAAREAVARLDEKGHQQVYAAIAQGQPIRAIQLYAQSTGCGLRAASAAVASMASHPIPFTRPESRQPQQPSGVEPSPAEDTAPREPEAAETEALKPETAPEVRDSAERDTPAKDTARSAAGSPGAEGAGSGKDKPRGTAKDKEPAAPDDAEISKWAQNLRPEDF